MPARRTRFLLDRKNDYSSQKHIVKPRAFLPRNGEVSVFDTEALSESHVWDLGERHVAIPRNRTLKGRADLDASAVPLPLWMRPDNSPPRHVTILGWPDEKEKQLSLSQELAGAAVLFLLP